MKCQICGKDTFLPEEQVINIEEVFFQWEEMGQISFPKEVWDHYLSGSVSSRLYKCSYCGFSVFIPTISGTNAFYDAISASDYYVEEKWEHNEGRKDLLKIKPCKLLDIGCGTGEFLNLIRENMPEMDMAGIDFSPVAVRVASDRRLKVDLTTDLEKSLHAFEDEQYDVITLFQVLEHLHNPSRILSVAKEKIRPGGFLIIAVPDDEGCVKHFPNSHTAVPPHHVSRWAESVFRKGFQNLGFQVVRIAKEPLPDYLWQSYLPVLWDEHVWLRLLMLFVPPFLSRDKYKKTRSLIRLLGALRIRNIYGLPGHTIYVLLQRMK